MPDSPTAAAVPLLVAYALAWSFGAGPLTWINMRRARKGEMAAGRNEEPP